VGDTFKILIYQHVREDHLSLYGFLRSEEKKLFIFLIGVSGIGPKLALSVLSSTGLHDFTQAIHESNVAALTSISGIGKKTASRLILELKDKLQLAQNLKDASEIKKEEGALGKDEDAIQALIMLGYSYPSARTEVQKLKTSVQSSGTMSLEDMIRYVLKK